MKRRLTLSRESLMVLEADELSSVAGAVSTAHPLCLLKTTTSAMHSACETCGIACTYNCGETS